MDFQDEKELTGEEYVRLILEEAGDRSASAVNQIVYLFERSFSDGQRFRFTFQPFLGVRDATIDGLVQAAKLSLMLGRNGMPAVAAVETRKRLHRLLTMLPSEEHDLRLVAVTDFVSRKGWHSRAKLTLEDMLERALPQFAPRASLSVADAVELVGRLETESGCVAAVASS